MNNFSDLPKHIKELRKEQFQLYHGRPTGHPKEPVVNGDIKWEPVDIVAARVVAKAPWC